MFRTAAGRVLRPLRQSAKNQIQCGQRRHLAVHEYVAMDVLKKGGIPTPRGAVAASTQEALKAAQSLGVLF